MQRRDVPAPLPQPVHVGVERRGEPLPAARIEDARIFLQAGKNLILGEHRIADVLLSRPVTFVM